jgi:hypothetical protein
MSDPGQDTHAQAAAGPRRMSLFVVERRLPKVTEQQLAVLLAALSGAAGRFNARGGGVWYLQSIFLTRQERLLSLFTADSLEAVRAVSQAALVPFAYAPEDGILRLGRAIGTGNAATSRRQPGPSRTRRNDTYS